VRRRHRRLAVAFVATAMVWLGLTASGTPGVALAGTAVGSDGGIFGFGNAAIYGSTGSLRLSAPLVGMAATPGGGYWLVASDGGIFNYGDAGFYGSTGNLDLNNPVVGMAATPDGHGYWLVASDGGIFTYGDAGFYGSRGGQPLNKPIVGMAATPDGHGYWLVASDGGIFAYGDASFYGSTGSLNLNRPAVGMAATPDGEGYWLVASDGGIFGYGEAAFYGSTGDTALNRPVVGMAATPDGEGYWLVAADGAIFAYGDAAFYGSTGGSALIMSVVGMAATPDGKGYWLVASDGGMSAPVGYTNQQMIFDNQFSGTSLDSSEWVTYQGAQGTVWNNFGNLPSPYSGPNSVANGGNGFGVSMFSPSQDAVKDGLTLTAQRNTNQWASTYPWISGIVNTETKFSLPATGWYVQVKVQMPDMTQGMWPAIWFMPDTSASSVPELDLFEGGFKCFCSAPQNDLMHSDYFSAQGQQQSLFSVGTDMTAGYHVYGIEFLPGKSITAYFDGKQVWQVLASSRVTITAGTYELMLDLEVAAGTTSGWRTVPTGATPSASMDVAEIQAYS
jgi:hypothetical protein